MSKRMTPERLAEIEEAYDVASNQARQWTPQLMVVFEATRPLIAAAREANARAEQAEARVAELELAVQGCKAVTSGILDALGSMTERAEAAEAKVKALREDCKMWKFNFRRALIVYAGWDIDRAERTIAALQQRNESKTKENT